MVRQFEARITAGYDATSTAGKPLVARERADLLVIGAGAAGLAAAIEAARIGLKVMLVDENPVDPALMGLDVPFHFGQRMSGAVRNRTQMMQSLVASEPLIGEAFDAGVDVRLGVAAWGLFTQRPGLQWVRGRFAGLSDGESTWLTEFDAVIVATGRRDIGIAFPGWELPGVMGVTAADTLLHRYGAFDGRRLVLLGSGSEAMTFAVTAMREGLDIAAIVEASEAAIDAERCATMAEAGVPIFVNSMIGRVLGQNGVERVSIVNLHDGQLQTDVLCDSVVIAIGVAPVIELLDVVGAEIAFSSARGGHVPIVDSFGRTSVRMVFAAGDCIGVDARKSLDPAEAAREGVRAAQAAAAALAASDPADWPYSAPLAAERNDNTSEARLTWAAASMQVVEPDTCICQCEEVRLSELVDVRPPRYLACNLTAFDSRNLATLAADGPLNQDQIKRLTRAGMGPCQGRRCREQISAILAKVGSTPLGSIPMPSYRAPVRPLPLAVFAEQAESREIGENWVDWFGIQSQWVPFWQHPSAPGTPEDAA